MIAGDDSALSQLRNETVGHALVSKTLSAKALLNALPEDRRSTPVLVVDLSVAEQDFREFLSSFPGTRVLYAVKANPDPDVLSRLARLGADFEISSVGELRLLMRLGISGERIISSNPVKTEELITQAHRIGVSHFAFDSEDEVEKIAACAPGAGLSVRLTVPNTGSDWPLDRKYGVKMDDAVHLLEYARGKGLDPSGVTFHVGSQCRSLDSWTYALGEAKQLWERCLAVGIRLDVINVGGGMPVVYGGQDALSITAIGDAILKAKAKLFPPDVRFWVEPGRAVIGRAGTMLCSVIGSAQRNGTRWLFVDAGIFHGLTEAMGGISYQYLTDVDGPLAPCTLAGPSCDSVDIIAEKVMLPNLRSGDMLVIPAAGAYTTVYASNFNGFPAPETVVIHGGGDD